MKKAIFLIGLCISFMKMGYGQQSTDLKQVFLAAESYYLFEEFEEALPLYLRLHRAEPDNYNLYFKIGVCYLNDPYEKDKSIFYLEKATKNINPKYKDSNYKEQGAPLDALFFLGNAYRVNNDLDKAREAYKKFQSQMNTEIYDDNLVIEQLTACDVAERLMKKPVDMDVEILSNQINTRFADKNPAISGDESKMVFISQLQFYDAVFFTEKINRVWTNPRNITPELGVDGDVYPTCLSYDGNQLIVYRNDDFIGNLYTSKLVNGLWTPLVKMNDNINTKYWESHASLSKDGKTLYFTSNRKEGYGGLDIYKSNIQANGDWGAPVNLGSKVNSPYNEETPFITENGRRLFFSSYGHYNMGGYDVFMTKMQPDSTWANPVNMGYPVNSTDDDVFFCPVRDGEIAYFPVYKETGYGKFDIYRYNVYNADHPRKYDITGRLNYSGENVKGTEIFISVVSQNQSDTLAFVHPDDAGKFAFSIPAGKYSMIFDSKRFEQVIKALEVSPETPHTGMSLNEQIKLTLLPEKLTQEELNAKLQLKDSLIIVKNGKTVKIDYEAEKGSVVVIKQYLDSILVKTDTVLIDRRKQSYAFEPKPGINNIEFTLTDQDGNQITKNVIVNYPKDGDTSQVIPQILTNTENTLKENKVERGVPDENLKALVNELASRTDGRLKEVIENLDFEKEGITNTSELFQYLNVNAEKHGYSREDVDRLYADMISKKDLAEFLTNLKNASEGNLQSTISKIDLKANSINTPYQASDFLIRNAQTYSYKPEDVIKALATVGAQGSDDLKLFVNKLTHSADEGAFKVYLKYLDLTTLENKTPEEFSVNLYLNSIGKPYTVADVLVTLTNLAVSRDASDVLKKLIALAEDPELKEYLSKLDLQKEGIYTADQLIAHLYANADMKGFSTEDIDLLLQKYLYNQVSEIDDLRLKMASLATGNLKKFLEKTDLNENSFGSREEFIEYLKSQAAQNGFTIDDVSNILLKLAYSGDLNNIIKQLTLYADGNLRKTLKNLNPEKEGIVSFDELIRYLLDNNEKYDYSKEDVYTMLSDYTAATDLDYFMRKLIRLADPETRTYLQNVDLKGNAIGDRAELTSFLLKEAEEGAIKQEKIIPLLLNANDTMLKDILPSLQSRSVGELNKFLNSGKLPVKELFTAADLYNFLIQTSTKTKSILPSEINKLFSEYLIDDALNQFLCQLIDHSDGKLNEFLRKLNLKESGITSVSGLIEYLLSNAIANGYTQDDVFRMIQKVLGREKLQDFISNLIEFAPDKLAKFLEQIDLDKEKINSVEDLMRYLSEHSAEFGFTMDDVWNAILQIVISGEDKARNEIITTGNKGTQISLGKGLVYTGVIFGILGIVIFFLILFKRKKNKDQ